MKHTSTLPAVINAIREAHQTGNDAEASRLFQVLYGAVRSHVWNAYSAVLFDRFRTNDTSLRAEEVFHIVLLEVEREIRSGKLVVAAGSSDTDVRKIIIARVCLKAVWRTKDAMEKWKRRPVQCEADLQFSTLGSVAEEIADDPEDERIVRERIACVFGKMRGRDAQILHVRFYSAHSKEEAERILMEQFSLSESGLERAISRAKERFRELWIEQLDATERKPIPT